MQQPKGRSLFWPILLIAIGAIWLLGNMNLIPDLDFRLIWRLWPLVLIVIGLNLIVGRRSPLLSALIAVGTVIVIIAFLLVAPDLDIGRGAEVQTAHFSEPVDQARSARVELNLSVGDTELDALSDSNVLVDADLEYLGEVDFEASGAEEKIVRLTSEYDSSFGRGIFDLFDIFGDEDLRWKIGLNAGLPIDLDIDSGVGKAELDLSDLHLTGLRIDGGVGNVDLQLPSTESSYRARINGGVGEFSVRIEEGAAAQLTVNSGVGNVSIDVPRDAAVRVDASTGVGNISVPSYFDQVSREDRTVGEAGIWETPGFDEASRQIVIEFDGGVGGLRIR